MRVTGLVPARFLTIVAHLVIVIVIFWSKVSEYSFEFIFNYLPHTLSLDTLDSMSWIVIYIIKYKESSWS